MAGITLGGVATDPNALLVGEPTLPRDLGMGTAASATSGRLSLTYFTPTKTETVTQIRTFTGSAAAGATPTLCRVGVYSVAANGDLTLVASTANDTTLWGSVFGSFLRSLTTGFTKVAGQRYAVGQLIVTAAAVPSWPCGNINPSTEAYAVSPRLASFLSGQTDLPASITGAGLTAGSTRYYTVLLP